jgi:hypothetical protein
MSESQNTISTELLAKINRPENIAMGITGSPSSTLEVVIDITEQTKTDRTLGQMVYVIVEEDKRNVLVIGQIIEIETKNRWHEDQAFKGVIKRHGGLPHLSGHADNRIATISVQACYDLGLNDPRSHILGTSPSTGIKVFKMNDSVMETLMTNYSNSLTYMGTVYGTNVNLPFWFKHFDKDDITNSEKGAKDAYHIGVFGKTGSGKTVTAAYMLLGYAKNKNNMNILILDPQGQFYDDKELLPDTSLQKAITDTGMKYKKFKILEDLYLPSKAYDIFSTLLQKSGFIKKSFNILSDREENAAEAIALYLEKLNTNSQGKNGNLNNLWDENKSYELMKFVLKKFTESETSTGNKPKVTYNEYIDIIFSQSARKDQLIEKLNTVLSNEFQLKDIFKRYWQPVARLFTEQKDSTTKKTSVDSVIGLVTTPGSKGNFVILDLSERKGHSINENLQAMFVNIIENKIKEKGEDFYRDNLKVNCLIVMDEAHRFISKGSDDNQIAALTEEITDSIRTTRKYGIGYMFITQTIESLDAEILRQIRIFAFGYGLTSGQELRKVSEVVNNNAAVQLYKSFIDPSSNEKYPFMFFGPVSPLSFTGSPLFIEVYREFSSFK